MFEAVATNDEQLWFKFSQLYRWVLRNEGPAIDALSAVPHADKFILWFTDVSNFDVTRTLTQIAWDFSRTVNGLIDATVDASLLLVYSQVLVAEWVKETGGGQ